MQPGVDFGRLRPYRGRVHRHAAGPRHQIDLERDDLGRAEWIGLSADAEQAGAQTPLQRSETLPFQPIERVSRRMSLRHDVAGEVLAPIVVVTLGAGNIELALSALEDRASGIDVRLEPFVASDF